MRIFTLVDNPDDVRLDALISSARKGNLDVEVVVAQEKLGPSSFGLKLKYTREYLRNLDPMELVMYVDGYDVLMDTTMEKIENELKECQIRYDMSFDNQVLFSAETNCWPDPALHTRFLAHFPSPFRFLCAGCFIGQVRVLGNLLDNDNLQYDESTDDQYWWTLMYLNSSNLIVLDHACIIFQNLFGAQDLLEMRDGYWYNKATNTLPLVFHGNGHSKSFLFQTIGPQIGLETRMIRQSLNSA
jgi:hypothetical protein